jgi:uncharacterized membrane protein YebE (DUF533 family)
MNFQSLLNQFSGSSTSGSSTRQNTKSNGLTSVLMGAAAASGVMGLLVGSKQGRKFAGNAATVGGAALIGGIAFKAYKNRQHNNQQSSLQIITPALHYSDNQASSTEISEDFQLTLTKAMIGAAKSEGHIDEAEQKRIFDAVKQMNLSSEMKGLVFELLRQPIYIEELAYGAQSMEQKSEVYLASCLTIDLDNTAEYTYLNQLVSALRLPLELAIQIKSQAKQALDNERALN